VLAGLLFLQALFLLPVTGVFLLAPQLQLHVWQSVIIM
jgi:hypothetical protein